MTENYDKLALHSNSQGDYLKTSDVKEMREQMTKVSALVRDKLPLVDVTQNRLTTRARERGRDSVPLLFSYSRDPKATFGNTRNLVQKEKQRKEL